MRFDQVKFGHRIKHLRKTRNLTQEQLATALHISTDHLGKIELGKRGISIDLLFDISAALHVSFEYLLKGAVHTSSQTKELIDHIRELLDRIESLSENPL